MTVTIEEAKQFVKDAEKYRENWLQVAVRSWDEIKKRQPNTNRIWAVNSQAARKRGKYPAWYSIYKIRQSIVLSRQGIPIGKDTTQDGRDPLGETAAVLKERLAVNIAKSFDFLDVMYACRDDFLVTDFSIARAYYERDEVKEYEKNYITPVASNDGQDVIFYDSKGKEVYSDNIKKDEQGFFIHSEKVVDVENEKICLEPVLYKDVYIDPGIRRWNRVKRLAFRNYYSEVDFKRIFGATPYTEIALAISQRCEKDEASAKNQDIEVFEYWDSFEKECFYFTKDSSDFFKPLIYPDSDANEDSSEESFDQLNGIYNLPGFYPCPKPLIINAPTSEFWPVPEFYQIIELLENIHLIFSRILLLTRAVRARLLYDKDIEGLAAAVNEAEEADAVGVTNLSGTLSKIGGNIKSAAQYLPIDELITGLGRMWENLQLSLDSLFRLTGTSDLLQGLTTEQSGKTLGERQIEEKYAINQILERQDKMAKFVRDSYELIADMALRNFKDESLNRYIMPETLSEKDLQNYIPALELLKNNEDRFRIELETDSTIALNESYDKQMRIEMVNTLTSAIEKVASTASNSPALLIPELHALKFLLQGFRQAKMFQTEITQAIDNVIQKTQQELQTQEPPFDKERADFEIKKFETEAKINLDKYKVLSDERIAVDAANLEKERFMLERERLSIEDRIAAIGAEVKIMGLNQESQIQSKDLALQYNKLSADIQLAQEQLANKRAEISVELRKVADKKEVDTFVTQMDAMISQHEAVLADAQQRLEEQKMALDEREKYMTEARLQSEHELSKVMAQLEIATKIQANQQQAQVEAPPPIVHVHMPEPKQINNKRRVKVVRDSQGNISELEHIDEQSPV